MHRRVRRARLRRATTRGQPEPLRGPRACAATHRGSTSTRFPDGAHHRRRPDRRGRQGRDALDRAAGTHTGEIAGIAPTGKEVTVSGLTISTRSGGKVVEQWTTWDTAGHARPARRGPRPHARPERTARTSRIGGSRRVGQSAKYGYPRNAMSGVLRPLPATCRAPSAAHRSPVAERDDARLRSASACSRTGCSSSGTRSRGSRTACAATSTRRRAASRSGSPSASAAATRRLEGLVVARELLADALGERLGGQARLLALAAQLLDRDVAGGVDLRARDDPAWGGSCPRPRRPPSARGRTGSSPAGATRGRACCKGRSRPA